MSTRTSDGKMAKSFFTPLKNFQQRLHHLEFELYTGRTHQIRVHAAEILRTPILNDHTYAHPIKQREELTRLLKTHKESQNLLQAIFDSPYPYLHAKHLTFSHPITQESLSFTTPPPEIWQKPLSLLY